MPCAFEHGLLWLVKKQRMQTINDANSEASPRMTRTRRHTQQQDCINNTMWSTSRLSKTLRVITATPNSGTVHMQKPQPRPLRVTKSRTTPRVRTRLDVELQERLPLAIVFHEHGGKSPFRLHRRKPNVAPVQPLFLAPVHEVFFWIWLSDWRLIGLFAPLAGNLGLSSRLATSPWPSKLQNKTANGRGWARASTSMTSIHSKKRVDCISTSSNLYKCKNGQRHGNKI